MLRGAAAKLRGLWIPTSYDLLLRSQSELLGKLVTTPVKQHQVPISGGRLINCVETVSKRRATNDARPFKTCVLAHGFGSGLGFYFPNLSHLAQRFDRVVAFDWLGFGGSSRPRQHLGGTPQEASAFFDHSLLEFCDAMGLGTRVSSTDPSAPDGPFTLVGHSLGGFLAGEFALSHPERLSELVLASPVGLAQVTRPFRLLPSTTRCHLPPPPPRTPGTPWRDSHHRRRQPGAERRRLGLA
jgi:cardiolipin-specific phospholipase